jgi:hypothetical protein
VRGTTLETVTGKDGEFRFATVRAGSQVVGAFRLGFKATSDTIRIVAGQTTNLTVKMSETSVNLSQVVVTGTAGNQERKAQAALVSSVSAADIINSAPVNNVANTLQSQVPGGWNGHADPHPRRVVDQPLERAAAVRRRYSHQRRPGGWRRERSELRPPQRHRT